MINVRFSITLYITIISFFETRSLFFNLNPERFIRERSKWSRNKTVIGITNPMSDDFKTLDFRALTSQYGYPAEEHLITTTDGYQLIVHRLPGSTLRPKAKGKQAVFLQHGLFASSDTWILMGPARDLAFMLVDAGYDVWLGNARGNTYSRSHVRFSPNDDEEFWKFSFHEIAVFDVTAAIDYILRETNQLSITYIGHSMGTTISYILLSTRPEYNDKIKLVISLAPTAFWHVPPRGFRALFNNVDLVKDTLMRSKINEYLPLTEFNAQFGKIFCSDESIFQQLCLNLFFDIFGPNPKQFNATLLPYLFSYFPAGASVQTIEHYMQHSSTGDFNMFDYGSEQNVLKYKQQQAPSYILKNIVAPVALIYGQGDTLIPPENSIELSTKLPNVITIETVADKLFSHADFLFARDVKTLLNDRVLEIIAKSSDGSSL